MPNKGFIKAFLSLNNSFGGLQRLHKGSIKAFKALS